MRPDLSQPRKTLTLRYGIFSFFLLLVFATAVYVQVAESSSKILQIQLRQLSSTAASELPLLRHEHDEMERAAPHYHPDRGTISRFDDIDVGQDGKRIRWFDHELHELSAYGGFQPRGDTIPAPAARTRTTILPLVNGLAIWQPVITGTGPEDRSTLVGYVSVALATDSFDAELGRLRRGLAIGSVLAGLVALVGSQWMVAVSLRPIRRQIEQLVRFTADASHELRHPLTAIRAVIGTLRQGSALEGSKPLVNEKLALIDQTCDRMGRVLEDLLLLARHDRQIDDQGDRRSFGLEELIEDLADLFSAPAQQQGVVLRTEIGARVPVHAQPERIRQLLVNLITNAIRFSPPGGTVTIGARNQGTDAMVWVDDQGPGIPLADRQRVFDRFWQADPSRSDPATLGLGLAIARAIATAHRGTLEAEEAPGGGCRMRLCLPRGH